MHGSEGCVHLNTPYHCVSSAPSSYDIPQCTTKVFGSECDRNLQESSVITLHSGCLLKICFANADLGKLKTILK